MLGSLVCRQEHFESAWYRDWISRLKWTPKPGNPHYDRKPWEFAAVAATLHERGKLVPGATGLGFIVGTEPLPSLFASFGVRVVATDLDASKATSRIWRRTQQHGDSREALFREDLVDREAFERHVAFSTADMNGAWAWEPASFDFVWSCCAFEHTGSLERGIDFVLRSSRLLKPGGVGVHTTEFNCSSNDKTVTRGAGVIYRQRDIEELDRRLRREGRALAKPDFWAGDGEYDRLYDTPPYFTSGKQHVKLEIDGYISTSMLVTVVN